MKTTVIVSGNRASVMESPLITSGTVGMVVQFEFDDQWQQLEKIAVFKAGHIIIDQIIDGNQSIIPWEVLTKPNRNLDVGIYGANDEGTIVIPTVWVSLGRIQPGADPSGDPAIDPTTPFWRQISKNSVFYTKQEGKTEEEKSIARANIGAAPAQPKADKKYFDITEYGMASLKPAYRGIGRNASQYSHSDNGVGNVGSQYEELPEVLTIPDMVNGIPVTSLAPGMFANHHRIKVITVPETVDEIPDYFVFRSLSIEEVKGCSGVSRLGDRAFYVSNIRKILMPNLLEIKGQNNFQTCCFLQIVDIGNVKKIPENCFKSCERLLRVNGGSGVTEVGAQAFLCATRLKSVPFAANLTSIGDYGFYRCRVNYPWENHPNKTGFGANSTYAAYNPVDFWTGKTYTAHETPLCATFNQGDPRWENETANADPWYRWAGDCCINSEAVAYSILTQDDTVTPLTYLDEVKKVIDTPPNINDQSSWPLYTVQERLTALGYTVGEPLYYSSGLKTLYNALAKGKLAIAECINGDTVAEASVSSYHAVLLHGINEDGEVMAHDSAGWSYILGVYEPITFSMPIQALTKANYRFYIVEKEA